MKNLYTLLVASLALAACGPLQMATAPKAVREFCQEGNSFSLGDVVELGENEDFLAELRTVTDGPNMTLIFETADGVRFQVAESPLPNWGEILSMGWGDYATIEVAKCSGHYVYELISIQPVSRPGPSVCSEGFTGSLKPSPFPDAAEIYREGDELITLYGNASHTGVIIYKSAQEAKVGTFTRPEDGEGMFEEWIPVSQGTLYLRVKTCGMSMFYSTSLFTPDDVN